LIIVKDRRLAWGDGGDRFGEIYQHLGKLIGLIGQRCYAGRGAAMVVSDLDAGIEWFGGNRVGEPIDSAGPEALLAEFFSGAEGDGVGMGIEANDIGRFSQGDSEAAALADGVVEDSLMLAEQAALRIENRAGLSQFRTAFLSCTGSFI